MTRSEYLTCCALYPSILAAVTQSSALLGAEEVAEKAWEITKRAIGIVSEHDARFAGEPKIDKERMS